MGSRIKILLVVLISGCAVSSYAGNPTGFLNFASFTTPGGQNYFETYLSVVGNSLHFVKNENNKYAAKAHVTISFKVKDSIVAAANFNVLSPEVNDSSIKPSFVDVHRFILPKGEYTMVFTLDDPNNATSKGITGTQMVHVGYVHDSASVSDAEFLQSYSPSNKPGPYNKCGYDMIPYVYTYYPGQVKKMDFYCEIYNSKQVAGTNGKITIQYSVESPGAYLLDLNNNFIRSVQMDADTVVPLLAQVPIDNLPTGNYQLLIKVMNNNNHILTQRAFDFTKENPGVKSNRIPAGFAVYMATRDTLEESIRCLAPISNNNERAYVNGDSLKWMPISELKRFFYYFWESRDSVNPLVAWQKYLDNVMAVKNSFTVPGMKGYKTDRGRVYLQYGAPNHRIVEKMNPVTYPHEIWEYYRFPDGQTDVKFVFYTTSIETNNYVLLHSTATGEIQDPHWQSALYSSVGTLLPGNLDQSSVEDQLGEDVNDEFNNPH
jgi:GWxTD domain-containing protein